MLLKIYSDNQIVKIIDDIMCKIELFAETDYNQNPILEHSSISVKEKRLMAAGHPCSIKLGNAWQDIWYEINRVKNNSPNFISGYGVKDEEILELSSKHKRKKIHGIFHKIDFSNIQVGGLFGALYNKYFEKSAMTQDALKKIRVEFQQHSYCKEHLLGDPELVIVDSIVMNNGKTILMEMRSSGNTDKRKSRATAEDLVKYAVVMPHDNFECLLGVLYSNNKIGLSAKSLESRDDLLRQTTRAFWISV